MRAYLSFLLAALLLLGGCASEPIESLPKEEVAERQEDNADLKEESFKEEKESVEEAREPSSSSLTEEVSSAAPSAPQARPSQTKASPPTITEPQATVLVRIEHEREGSLAHVILDWAEGQTAYEALVAAAQKTGLYVQSSGSGAGVYVEGIDHYFEFDEGPLSGWHFLINGVEGGRGSGQVILQSGDELLWQYRAEP